MIKGITCHFLYLNLTKKCQTLEYFDNFNEFYCQVIFKYATIIIGDRWYEYGNGNCKKFVRIF